MTRSVGLVGARGHTGRELLRLIAARHDLDLAFASSREFAGQPIAEMAPETGLEGWFVAYGPEAVAKAGADAIILALPNGASAGFVDALNAAAPDTVIVDLSADYRFDDDWDYGLPEIYGRDRLSHSRRISNPGCYATAGQLAIAPLRERIAGDVHVFGVSGYSGAGTTPSRKNDLDALRDNLMPYALTGHIHEREMTRHTGCGVRFTPHVAAFFRGIVATCHIPLAAPLEADALKALFQDAYAGEALIRIGD